MPHSWENALLLASLGIGCSAIGGVIWLGLLWQRHERTVGAKLRRRLPQPLRELIENRQ